MSALRGDGGVKVRRCDIISESLPFNFSPHVGHMADTDLI